jgi:hypothetical protein
MVGISCFLFLLFLFKNFPQWPAYNEATLRDCKSMNLICDNQGFVRDFSKKMKMEDGRGKMEEVQEVICGNFTWKVKLRLKTIDFKLKAFPRKRLSVVNG